jgi:hypothetical protein
MELPLLQIGTITAINSRNSHRLQGAFFNVREHRKGTNLIFQYCNHQTAKSSATCCEEFQNAFAFLLGSKCTFYGLPVPSDSSCTLKNFRHVFSCVPSFAPFRLISSRYSSNQQEETRR